MVLVLPLVFVFLLTIIELGLLLSNWQHVKRAAFAGVRTAAYLSEAQIRGEDQVLGSTGDRRTAESLVKDRVDRTLAAAGISASQRVVVEFRPVDESASEFGLATVRITVEMASTDLSPDLLAYLGISLTGGSAEANAVCPHLEPPGP